jgi:hypothetical protein
MGSEHFERHRGDVDRLVALAASEGVTITAQRAYRAWSRHSDSMAAGWMGLGEDDDIAREILTGQLRSLDVEDIGAGVVHRGDLDELVAKCGEEGIPLSRDEILAAWADHSAATGRDWIHIGWRTIGDAVEVLRRVEPVEGSGPSFG